MAKTIQIKGIINDLKSKIGRKGNRFCEIVIRLPTNAKEVTDLVMLQGVSVQIDMVQIQENLFTDDE